MTSLVSVSQRVETIVKALRRKPLKRFSTAELSDATGIERTVITSNMKHWMAKNEGDIAHVHLEAVKGHAHYYYDPDHERTGPPPPIRKSSALAIANTDTDGVVRVKRNGHAKEPVFLKLAAEEDGFVLAYTADGRVMRGRWLE